MKAIFSICLSLACLILKAQIPVLDHVVIVIFENKDYSQIIGSGNAPYINSLANDPYGALFTQSYANQNTSQPNYLHLFSGSDQGVTTNGLPSGLPFTTPNLGASLLANGYTFVGYAEDLPSIGFTGTTSGAYVRKHCPWINWQGSGTNGIPAALSQPFSNFPSDYSTLPTVSFVIPNLNNDMHDPITNKPLAVSNGDTWLQSNLNAYVQWAKTNNSLLIITFDEDDFTDLHIATIFIGQNVLQGQYNETINHHNILRTLEDMYGLPYAGNSGNVSAITDVWITSPLPIGLQKFEAAFENGVVKINWITATEINNEFFTIENSKDGRTFNTAGIVKGTGTTSKKTDYTFIDKHPYPGRSYYRLKQTDLDGKYSYSNIVSVWDVTQSEHKPEISIFPNPSSGAFTLSVKSTEAEKIYLHMTDCFGNTVHSETFSREESGEFNISYKNTLSPGLYFIHVTIENFTLSTKAIIR